MEEHSEIDASAATNGHANSTMAPVLAGTQARAIEPASQPPVPAPVVAAAGGAVAGAVAYVLLRVLRSPARRRGVLRVGKRRRRGSFEITGSRSFLVDVHMLKR
jgi:peptidoglycan/LPS O-acetylase OafA/YrhL